MGNDVPSFHSLPVTNILRELEAADVLGHSFFFSKHPLIDRFLFACLVVPFSFVNFDVKRKLMTWVVLCVHDFGGLFVIIK